ncbi:MAG TPA: hypothetical protein PKC66_15340, partial [Leptospiraceae bacterium]|nr:hypothetical protein [Leptospiraceae bacterium]
NLRIGGKGSTQSQTELNFNMIFDFLNFILSFNQEQKEEIVEQYNNLPARQTFKRNTIAIIQSLKGFEVLEPIKIEISIEYEEYLVEIPELEIYAYDKDIHECIKEIKEDIIRLYYDLNRERKEILGEKPKKWKDFLNYSIKKI